MDELLGNIYCWLESLFGQNLGEYLWGYDCNTQTYGGKNLFNTIGLITLAVSFLSVLAYYYFINHTRFAQWWHWLIVLIVSGVINFFIAYGIVINDFLNGSIGDCLMYIRDEEGNVVSQLIYESDSWAFGLSNFFVSTLFFIVFSFMFKWWSSNCKHSPFI
jgi:hypothetical protein